MTDIYSPHRRVRIAEAARQASGVRAILTPEGVPLNWELGSRGDRLGAFAIDLVLVGLMALLILLITGFVIFGAPMGEWNSAPPWAVLVLLVGLFLLRSFYFTVAELAWRGRTPGKFLVGLRVVDAGGGPLLPGAVVARNLMRELEIFLPLGPLFAPEQLGWPEWAALLAAGWLIAIGGLPLFNRDRQRLGDLLGGTWVIRQPKLELLPDLSAIPPQRQSEGSTLTFERAQVDVYGIKELQTLEEVLRNKGREAEDARMTVARTIQQKIGWKGETVDPATFLAAYYAALREHLESRLTLGERLEDKIEAAARRDASGKNGRNGAKNSRH